MMENKPVILITVTIIMMISVLLIAANHLKDVDKEIGVMENDTMEAIEVQREITSLESRLTHLEQQMPGVDVDQALKAANMELLYIKDLLNKVTEIETVNGWIIGYDISKGILLNVETLETEQIIEIPLAESCTQYMITEFTFAPITTEEFKEYLEEAEGETEEVFTFKIIDGKAVQILPVEKVDLLIQN